MEIQKKIIRAFEQSGQPMRPGEIADATQGEKKEVESAIKKMKDAGVLHSPKRCFYDIHR